jgi:thioredoxin 1
MENNTKTIICLDLDTALFELLVLKNTDKAVLVDFWAPWCAPCVAMGPILDEIATEQHEALDVYKVNVDEEPLIAIKYSIASIPTAVLFVDGKPVKIMTGARSKRALLAELYLD